MYQLNPSKFSKKIEEVESVREVMWSKTLRWFYSIPLGIVVIVFIVKYWSVLCTVAQFCKCK